MKLAAAIALLVSTLSANFCMALPQFTYLPTSPSHVDAEANGSSKIVIYDYSSVFPYAYSGNENAGALSCMFFVHNSNVMGFECDIFDYPVAAGGTTSAAAGATFLSRFTVNEQCTVTIEQQGWASSTGSSAIANWFVTLNDTTDQGLIYGDSGSFSDINESSTSAYTTRALYPGHVYELEVHYDALCAGGGVSASWDHPLFYLHL